MFGYFPRVKCSTVYLRQQYNPADKHKHPTHTAPPPDLSAKWCNLHSDCMCTHRPHIPASTYSNKNPSPYLKRTSRTASSYCSRDSSGLQLDCTFVRYHENRPSSGMMPRCWRTRIERSRCNEHCRTTGRSRRSGRSLQILDYICNNNCRQCSSIPRLCRIRAVRIGIRSDRCTLYDCRRRSSDNRDCKRIGTSRSRRHMHCFHRIVSALLHMDLYL